MARHNCGSVAGRAAKDRERRPVMLSLVARTLGAQELRAHLSAASTNLSMLDTGRPTQIKGNVEYDRYSMWVYDYLNFITYYFKFALKTGVDMESVETLDDLRQPLFIDRFPYTAVHQGYQLFQRGVNWKT